MKNQEIQNSITELLKTLNFSDKDISVSFDEPSNTIWFSLTSPGTRLLLTRDAEALQALNHIATRMVEHSVKEGETYPRVVIDANDFEKKKIEGLKTTAHMMAERARYFKASVELDAMSAHDRRIVHEFLSAVSDVSTESSGEGTKRHIVIKYTGGI